jgi:hypothetical protein
MRLHVDTAATQWPQRLAPPVTRFITPLSVRINCAMLAIRKRAVYPRSSRGRGGQMEVNGIAHIFLTASNFERSREFYRKLLPFLGLKPMIDSDTSFYCVGGRTAVGINAPASEHAGVCVRAKPRRVAPSLLSRPRARRRR